MEVSRTENENFKETVERIASKYVKLVEERIDNTQNGLSGQDLRDIYDGIQLLGNIMSTLERLSRMK